jgi:hypothetical protein
MENTASTKHEHLETEEENNNNNATLNEEDSTNNNSASNNNEEGVNYDIQQSDQIDLYADVDANDPTAEPSNTHNLDTTSNNNNNTNNNDDDANLNNEEGVIVSVSATDEPGLYDDVMAAPTPTNISASDMDGNQIQHEDMNTNRNDNGDEFYQDQSKMRNSEQQHSEDSQQNRQASQTSSASSTAAASGQNTQNSGSATNGGYARRVSCYIGNLTWWTNDKTLTEVIQGTLAITDLIDIKFYENKINGQSKGFASVIVGSDTSFRTLMDKLPKIPINGQEPLVTPFNRFYYNQFEEQARKDMPSMANNGGGGGYDNYNDSGNGNYNYNNSSSYNGNGGGYNNNNNGYRMNNQGGSNNSGPSSMNNMNNGNGGGSVPYSRDNNMSMLQFIYLFLSISCEKRILFISKLL